MKETEEYVYRTRHRDGIHIGTIKKEWKLEYGPDNLERVAEQIAEKVYTHC